MVERDAVLRPEFILERDRRVLSISSIKPWTFTSVDWESMCGTRSSRGEDSAVLLGGLLFFDVSIAGGSLMADLVGGVCLMVS
jgi:hypothetical protein